MTPYTRGLAALAALAAALASPVGAQAVPAAPVPAESLVARHVAAMGGREALERIPGRWLRAHMEIVGTGIRVAHEEFTAGGRQFARSEIPGMGVVLSGFDGEVGWSVNPLLGPMLVDGLALQQAREGADFLAVLHPPRYVAELRTVEETDFGGTPCWKVRVTTPWQESYDEYFDRETGVLVGGTRTQASPQGDIPVTAQVEAWTTVGGVRFPSRTRTLMMGREIRYTVDTVEFRAIPDSVFVPPPEIRALRAAAPPR